MGQDTSGSWGKQRTLRAVNLLSRLCDVLNVNKQVALMWSGVAVVCRRCDKVCPIPEIHLEGGFCPSQSPAASRRPRLLYCRMNPWNGRPGVQAYFQGSTTGRGRQRFLLSHLPLCCRIFSLLKVYPEGEVGTMRVEWSLIGKFAGFMVTDEH